MTQYKCGYVALIGRPNVGKSTLLNTLIGQKISITTPKPQTTRSQILGIETIPGAQIIYIDTPGIHEDQVRAMNRYMNRIATSVIVDADVIVFIVDATRWNKEDDLVLSKLKNTDKPVILAVNKVDLIKDKSALLPLMDKLKSKFDFKAMIPLSARKNDNVKNLEKEIIQLLPEAPAVYPEDQVTDKSMKFLAAEIIREKLIQATSQELPYATTVEIEQYEETEAITKISAVIWVERDGQKAIVIGEGGSVLKKVGTAARRDIEKLIEAKVFLSLWVKVKAEWSDNETALKSLGYE